MTALEQFQSELKAAIDHAHQSRVPLENIILELDVKHFEELVIRQHITAAAEAQRRATEIVPASGIPLSRLKHNGA